MINTISSNIKPFFIEFSLPLHIVADFFPFNFIEIILHAVISFCSANAWMAFFSDFQFSKVIFYLWFTFTEISINEPQSAWSKIFNLCFCKWRLATTNYQLIMLCENEPQEFAQIRPKLCHNPNARAQPINWTTSTKLMILVKL